VGARVANAERALVSKLEEKVSQLALKDKLPWVKHLKGRVRAWYFERGLIGELTLYSKRFVAEGASYFEQDPIRAVKFVTLNSTQGAVKPEVLFRVPAPGADRAARLQQLPVEGRGPEPPRRVAAQSRRAVPRSRQRQPAHEGRTAEVAQGSAAIERVQLPLEQQFRDGHAKELAKCRSSRASPCST